MSTEYAYLLDAQTSINFADSHDNADVTVHPLQMHSNCQRSCWWIFCSVALILLSIGAVVSFIVTLWIKSDNKY